VLHHGRGSMTANVGDGTQFACDVARNTPGYLVLTPIPLQIT